MTITKYISSFFFPYSWSSFFLLFLVFFCFLLTCFIHLARCLSFFFAGVLEEAKFFGISKAVEPLEAMVQVSVHLTSQLDVFFLHLCGHKTFQEVNEWMWLLCLSGCMELCCGVAINTALAGANTFFLGTRKGF